MNNQTSILLSENELDAVSGGGGFFGGGSHLVGSGTELSMISLQSLISQRSTLMQLTTDMMNSMNDGMKTVAGNVGH
jgi:hypothetical protein